jgi:phosphoglycerate-specific signal transduction histidine kinase
MMGLVEKTSDATGIPFERDVPAKGNRRCRDWATVIGTIRKLESQENEDTRQSLQRIEELTAKLADNIEARHAAERECEQLRLQMKILKGDFSSKDQKYLLEEAAI